MSYWDDLDDLRRYREAPDGLGYDEYNITCTVERMIEMGCKVDVMELFDKLTERFRLNSFSD